jgi:hypothetical protein
MQFRALTALGAAAVLAFAGPGCGGGDRGSSEAGTTRATRPQTARQRRELAQLRADIRRIRAASAPLAHSSLMGSPALMAATSRFLDDEQRSALDNKTKNRLIDLAAGAVAGTCEQCFQQLEAVRPIPQIAGH